MSDTSNSTVYIGNLDDRVSERVLYDILIQAGWVVDLYLPRDKETEKRKGYAFAQYETDEIANYAVKLFSGLVTLYNRTLKFAISGQDKASHNTPASSTPAQNGYNRPSSQPVSINGFSIQQANYNHGISVPRPHPGVDNRSSEHGSRYNGNSYEYSRRMLGLTMDGTNRSRPRRFDSNDPVSYPSY